MNIKTINVKRPLVSIVVVNWNGQEVLVDCLNSLINLEYNPFEIIVVDNASTDSSMALLDKYSKRITVIANTVNIGYVKACNMGVRTAKGKYVATVNNDVTVQPEWINDVIPYFEEHEEVGIASCCQIKHFQRNEIDSLFSFINDKLFAERFCTSVSTPPRSYVFAANGGSAIYRKSLFDQIGLFLELYDAYHEECDLSFRALINGWKCVFFPTAVVYHRVNFSFNRNRSAQIFLHERNKVLFWLNNYPVRYLAGNILPLMLGEISDMLHYLKNRRYFPAYLRARWAALKYLLSFQWKAFSDETKFMKYQEYFEKLKKDRFIPI